MSQGALRYTFICSKHFEGGLGPTKANPVPTIFDFPENLQRQTVYRQDASSFNKQVDLIVNEVS